MQISNRIRYLLPSAVGLFSFSGLLLRYFQRKNELLPDGSLTEGAFLHTIVLILSVCVVIGSAALLWKLAPRTSWSQLANRKGLPLIQLFAAAFLLLGNLLLLLRGAAPTTPYTTSAPELSDFLNNLLPPLGIVAAVCMALFSYKCFVGQKPSALFYMFVSLYLVVRLIVRFQAWNTDPSIHDYCYALLANISAMLATFHMAGFSFDKGKRRMTLFWLVCTAFFSMITLADALHDGDFGEFFIHLSMSLMVVFNLDQLLYEKE
ncbi:MAG: hypothetical protein E7434_08670 [Ruminococcaceae bacterium]|nr:hypothetical protein [Oscillospiraceae bacterium]